MTYENMIQWAINEGLDFDGFISEFGQDFSFLEDQFIEERNFRGFQSTTEQFEKLEPEEELPSPTPEQEGLISRTVTSFINFFRGK